MGHSGRYGRADSSRPDGELRPRLSSDPPGVRPPLAPRFSAAFRAAILPAPVSNHSVTGAGQPDSHGQYEAAIALAASTRQVSGV
jgi:hypothetical protein